MGSKERREREKEDRRRQILNAARHLLFDKGLNGTTVNKIAKMAELSVGLIYFYFKSKEEIYAALQEEGLEILYILIQDRASTEDTCAVRLKNISEAYYEFSEKYKDYFDILNYFLTSPERLFPQNLKRQIDAHGNKILSILDDVIISGCEKGEITVESPRHVSIMFWSIIHGYLQFRKLRETILHSVDYRTLYRENVNRFIKSIT
ncbi:MAG: hypothetical protein CVV44_22815 [Spirochaetae bacterium HGW-Spirochaetae-1]|jgi:AcrR family transcriptional regulator|nr:MAG: hypothetical protein CVV44_22815 [Spirochaetae bacterium HGW-Spirochaetae-1]